jgi:hypothetical protein
MRVVEVAQADDQRVQPCSMILRLHDARIFGRCREEFAKWLAGPYRRLPTKAKRTAGSWSWPPSTVNFSALVEADEDNVLAAWRALRREIDPLIGSGGGRIFKSLGDGLLVEFTSPFDATRAAMEVQAAITKMAPERGVRVELRCAIHMDEVTVEGTDLRRLSSLPVIPSSGRIQTVSTSRDSNM